MAHARYDIAFYDRELFRVFVLDCRFHVFCRQTVNSPYFAHEPLPIRNTGCKAVRIDLGAPYANKESYIGRW